MEFFFVLFTAFSIVVIFIAMFISKCKPKKTSFALHRHPENLRRKRRDSLEIITTTDILSIVKSYESDKI